VEPDRMPTLPPDALILTSSDEATWRLEVKEYKALSADPAQQSFLPLLDSFKLKVGKTRRAVSDSMLHQSHFDGQCGCRTRAQLQCFT
jgi:hypothetical protein